VPAYEYSTLYLLYFLTRILIVVKRLEKLAEVFYTYVGGLSSVATAVDMDVDAVDVIYQYWLLKRKVTSVQ